MAIVLKYIDPDGILIGQIMKITKQKSTYIVTAVDKFNFFCFVRRQNIWSC